ncbi:hypothetical protein C8R44DRAFT_883131 [Mycena epipterygia]|nr:hypothetical protein C8R44DRAFT_883131 [Mycena epipterygia]
MIHHCHLSFLLLDETSCPSSFGHTPGAGAPRARYAVRGLDTQAFASGRRVRAHCQRAMHAGATAHFPAPSMWRASRELHIHIPSSHSPPTPCFVADGSLSLDLGLVQIPEVPPAGVARSVAVRGGPRRTVYAVLCGSLARSSFAALSISPPVLPGVERRFNLAQYGYPASTSGPLPQAHARASDDLEA